MNMRGVYHWCPKTSHRPLTLGKLIHLIDNLTLDVDDIPRPMSPSKLREAYDDCDIEPLDNEETILRQKDFVTVTSAYYPELEPWYIWDAERWAADQMAKLPERLKNT